ncbi:MAG: DUF4982 domain-containing protein [Bacteroides sp.]|nr:DUF4982 domain-containing protein [Bacteroides sp.]
MKPILNLCLALSTILTAQAREVINLNGGWEFHRGSKDAPAETVNLPHDFQISQPWVTPAADELPDLNNSVANIKSRLSARGFKEMGTGWYVRSLTPDPSWKGKRVVLDFEGILLVGDVYLNGEKIGSTDYGYLGLDCDISDRLNYDAPNIIEVFADTRDPKNSRWYTGAGLYRDVNLIVTDKKLHFERHPLKITTHDITPDNARVAIVAEIASRHSKKTPFEVVTSIIGPDNDTILTHSQKIKTSKPTREYELDTISIPAPSLWSCETPSLYRAEMSLIDPEGNECDRVSQRFGIRTISYSPENGFMLNGNKVLLKGIANHHTLGALGAAAYPDAMRKRISMLKDWGFNHIRTSHNPYSESFLDLCDEYGILVVDELYDKWLLQYAGGRRDWMELWPENVPEWIKRDRNHPSVIMWSLGNELQMLYDLPYHDYGVTPYKLQKALLERYDTTRPVTVAMHPRGRNHKTDSLPAALATITDIAAYNYRYMYFPGDARRFPYMIFYQSEASTADMGANWFCMDLDKVTGLAYWGAIDYLGESQGWPVKGWDKGVFDISLRPKPQAWFIRSYFRPDEPVVHIAVKESNNNVMWNDVLVGTDQMVDHWNFRAGSMLPLYTYTNADEVELFVNGKSYGRRRNNTSSPKQRNVIFWDSIPYSAGHAEAVAYIDGRKVATHRIETAGKTARLEVSVDEGDAPMPSDGISLRHITVRAVDSKGRTVPGDTRYIKVDVSGDAELVGLINGDMTSEELSTASSRRLHNGCAAAIIRSTHGDKAPRVTVSAEGLRPVTINIGRPRK